MHLAAGRLGGDEDGRGRMELKDRAWPKGQLLGAQSAGPHVCQEGSYGRHDDPL